MTTTFKATEFDTTTMQPTGRVEVYMVETAEPVEQAVKSCLYTRKLKDGRAFIGPSGRTVFAGNRCYSITKG